MLGTIFSFALVCPIVLASETPYLFITVVYVTWCDLATRQTPMYVSIIEYVSTSASPTGIDLLVLYHMQTAIIAIIQRVL